MENVAQPGPAIMIIFGAGGDLTWRKLGPALYNLHYDELMPVHLATIGLDKKEMSQDEYQNHLRDGIDQFSRRGKTDDPHWQNIRKNIHYICGDFSDPTLYTNLAKTIAEQEEIWHSPASHIFYMATPPDIVEMIVKGLGEAGLAKDRDRSRIVVEKPFGHDLASAMQLNKMLVRVFHENQIFRIDHYLGKETVQNILALRFANALFEPIWDRRYIDHVQITVAEQVGVEHRGGYYEHAGALRDMVQNHLLQILCLIAMEPMVSFNADEIRNKKVDVLRAIRIIPEDQVPAYAVRGQYDAGKINGEPVPAYRAEPGVAPDSKTETFVALKLFIDNWRWQDVPFCIRTGKRLANRISEVVIQFRPVPHKSFPQLAVQGWQPNRLVIHIQPEEGIVLKFQAKQPGTVMKLRNVDMIFSYKETFKASPPEAYETLLYDTMCGDATLFMRDDQVEVSWSVIMPILKAWESNPPDDFPNYPSGSWGPLASDALMEENGRNWELPTDLDQSTED
jgi:glucose-6-phosphate 1-dehydrogenase